MTLDSRCCPGGLLAVDHEWLLHYVISNLIFNELIEGTVRARYHADPGHVSLQIDRTCAALFVWDGSRSLIVEDDALHEWVMSFVARDVFGLDPDAIDLLYLDGVVGRDDPSLYITGDGILIACGEPVASKGIVQ
jgi:hypothetical protein